VGDHGPGHDAGCEPDAAGHGGLRADRAFYDRLVGDLSGGERVKLQLLAILVSASNLLILDEPTNYLDLPALEALADYLVGYPGTVLFVAHDQAFRQRVATRTLAVDHQRLADPQRTAQGTPATDLPRLRFEYDQLMQAPELDQAKLKALRQKSPLPSMKRLTFRFLKNTYEENFFCYSNPLCGK
jgi:ATPase components of ABC transporters with duplicated ATPase domains